MTIRLPLLNAWKAPRYDESKLTVVNTFDDDPSAVAYYEERGWDKYHPINHEVTMLPEFGPGRYFYRVSKPIGKIAGINFRIWIEDESTYYEQYEPDGKYLILEETDEPESIPDRQRPDFCTRGGHDLQLFGQPNWIQNPIYPADAYGECCHHLLTVENGWGDSGNWNIMVALGENGLPEIAYFEASCC